MVRMSHPFIVAIGMCAMAVGGEALLMGHGGTAFMKSISQPWFAPPVWAWSLIGLAYYAICFTVAYRLAKQPRTDVVAGAMLLSVMIANTVWNYVYFRMRDLRLTFWYSVAYTVLV